jgi:hypothetical protein
VSTRLAIDITASLKCELDGQSLDVQATGGVIVIKVETAKTARTLIGHARRFGKLRSTAARLNAILMATSHRLELHVDDTIVASMGQGTDSGLLRFAGLHNLRVWPLRLM